jgi:DNA-directed RNA polymerase II subunit RPB2
MCPFESPDGASIGYLKNMALLTKITAGINVENIKKCLIDIGIIPLNRCNFLINKNITAVFLNSTLYGYTGDPIFITRILKAYRRNGLINILISISWNIPNNEIRIYTEAGRPCRPLLILKNNKKAEYPHNDILVYKNNSYNNWFDMLNGSYNKLNDAKISYIPLLFRSYCDRGISSSSMGFICFLRYFHCFSWIERHSNHIF